MLCLHTPCGQVCRNRQHLNRRLNTADDNVADIPDAPTATTLPHTPEPQRDRIMTRTQTGANATFQKAPSQYQHVMDIITLLSQQNF